MGIHHSWRILVVAGSVLIFLATAVITALTAIPGVNGPFVKGADLLVGQTGFTTKILPSVWTFASLWIVTYIWTFALLMYGVSTLFRKSSRTTYLYYKPDYLSVWMYISLTIANILGAIWLLVADMQMLWQSLIVYTIELAFLGVAILVAIFALDKEKSALIALGKGREIGWTISLVHNGLGMYVTWIYFVTTNNLCSVMVYSWGVEENIACYVCLSLLAIEILGVFVIDNFVMYTARKYLLTPYLVSIVCLVGTLTNYYNLDDPVTIYGFVLLFVAIFALVFKMGWWLVAGKKSKKKKKIAVVKKKEVMQVKEMKQHQQTLVPAPAQGTVARPQVLPAIAYPGQQGTIALRQPTVTQQATAAVLQQVPSVVQPGQTIQQPVLPQTQPAMQAAPTMMQPMQSVMQPGTIYIQQPAIQQAPTVIQQPVLQPSSSVVQQPAFVQPMSSGIQQPAFVQPTSSVMYQSASVQPTSTAVFSQPITQAPMVIQSPTSPPAAFPTVSRLYPTLPALTDTPEPPPSSFILNAEAPVSYPSLMDADTEPFPESKCVFVAPDALVSEAPVTMTTAPFVVSTAPTTSVAAPPPVYVCGLEPQTKNTTNVTTTPVILNPPSYTQSTNQGPIDSVVIAPTGTIRRYNGIQ